MFKNITPDKWRHFEVGILMGLILQIILWKTLRDSFWLSTSISFLTIVAVSYGFELFSKITGKGTYDFIDAVASVIGGTIGMALAIFFQS